MRKAAYLPLIGLLLAIAPVARPVPASVVRSVSDARQSELFALHAAPTRKSARPLPAALAHRDIPASLRGVLAETLEALPGCRKTLRNVFIRSDGSIPRAFGGDKSILLNGNLPVDEVRALFIHECGHVTDLGWLRGSAAAAPSGFRDGSIVIRADDPSVDFYRISWTDERTHRQGVSDEDFVSEYSSWDPWEDFAESYTYYFLHEEDFRRRAQENDALRRKLDWLETHVFTDFTPVATGLYVADGRVPWDVTLLPYKWEHPNANP
ncbi:MAG: Uncharacterized protein G01um101425_739 [Candidatus Peregrinibacteria bacterium Gr01-1014_25]|nr:MAG: Uncharacterized protein G01um101425_739 [Candidatus Peregrinibacteria bacterium Gr01-1014_25]